MGFVDDLKKDKKKFFFVAVAIIIILLAVVLSVVKALGEEGEGESEGSSVEGVVIPVNESKIDDANYQGRSSSIKNSDFFSAGISKEEVIEQDTVVVEEQVSKPVVKSYSSGIKNSSGSISQKKQIETPVEEVVESAPSKELKRRTPSDQVGSKSSSSNKMFSAVVDNHNALVRSGVYVSFRLAEDVNVDGVSVPRNTLVTGIAQYGMMRMNVSINSIKVKDQFRKVNWEVYDEDGNPGLALPENIMNDLAKDLADEGVDGGGSVEGDVPILGRLKINVKKRNREVSFILNTGHRVYLKRKQ